MTNTTAAGTTRWICSHCGHAVSKQVGQHKHLRVRRPDGTGWDHTSCHPMPDIPMPDIYSALRARRGVAGLMQ